MAASSSASGRGLAICPHCWHVNPGAFRLCAGCRADMTTVLQESGGLRLTAPVQSPMPVRSDRLTPLQKLIVLGFLLLLVLGNLLAVFSPRGPGGAPPLPPAATR